MKKIIRSALTLAFLVALTGCMQISAETEFKADGTFVEKGKVINLALQAATEEASPEDIEQFGNGFCEGWEDKLKKDANIEVFSSSCEEKEPGIVKYEIVGKKKNGMFTVKDGVYTLKIETKGSNQDSSGNISENSNEGTKMLKALGLNIEETFIFPVPITNSKFGKVEGNKVTLTMDDLEKIDKLGEFKIVAGGENKLENSEVMKKRGSLRERFLRRRMLRNSRNIVQQPVKTRLSSRFSSRRFPSRHRSFRAFHFRNSNSHNYNFKVEKKYYHPFANRRGHGYRGYYRK